MALKKKAWDRLISVNGDVGGLFSIFSNRRQFMLWNGQVRAFVIHPTFIHHCYLCFSCHENVQIINTVRWGKEAVSVQKHKLTPLKFDL